MAHSDQSYSWTQPQCATCWEHDNPGRRAVRLSHPFAEKCVSCGIETRAGIYIRVDPTDALYPTHVRSS